MKTTPKQTEISSIVESAILVNIGVSKYGGEHRSKTLKQDAVEKHGAKADRVGGTVKLFERDDVKKIESVVSAMRSNFYYYTSPWRDDGWRYCPTANFNALKEQHESLTRDFRIAVEELVKRRDDLARKYEEGVKATLAAEHPFPQADELRGMFDTRFSTDIIYQGGDVRLRGLNDAQVATIKKQAEESILKTFDSVIFDVVSRLRDHAEHVVKVMTKEKPVIHKSLTGNIEEILPTLRALNASNNPKVASAIDAIEALAKTDTEKLKDDPELRKTTAKAANTILDQLKNFKPPTE